jgi:hypothetical protein
MTGNLGSLSKRRCALLSDACEWEPSPAGAGADKRGGRRRAAGRADPATWAWRTDPIHRILVYLSRRVAGPIRLARLNGRTSCGGGRRGRPTRPSKDRSSTSRPATAKLARNARARPSSSFPDSDRRSGRLSETTGYVCEMHGFDETWKNPRRMLFYSNNTVTLIKLVKSKPTTNPQLQHGHVWISCNLDLTNS